MYPYIYDIDGHSLRESRTEPKFLRIEKQGKWHKTIPNMCYAKNTEKEKK